MIAEADIFVKWEVLDGDTVRALVESKGIATLTANLNAASPSPGDRADKLVKLAIDGRMSALKTETAAFRDWAAEYGMRRIENALIELDRVLASSKRGEAILQAQALTRFIARSIDGDVLTLMSAIEGES